jgi:hypothetical protein
MLITNHVLSGAVIGAVTRRPVPAFVAGVASHFVLDAIPHWGDWRSREHFMYVAVRDGLTGLAVMAALTAIAPPTARTAVLAGMAGAALPDLDKPSVIYFGRSPFPRAVNEFHSAIQDEAQGRAHIEAGAALVFGLTALALLRAHARRARG